MIILHEANRFKQYLADKFEIKFPKGGTKNTTNLPMQGNDYELSGLAKALPSSMTLDERKKFHNLVDFSNHHNIHLPPTIDEHKRNLHERINFKSRFPLRNTAQYHKTDMIHDYGDKLTHKYDKQSTPTPEVEAPKSTNKPVTTQRSLFTDKERAEAQAAREKTSNPPKIESPKDTSKPITINGRKVQKRSLGVGKVKKQPTPTPEVEAPTSTSKPVMINGRKVQKRSLGVGRKKQVPNTPEVEAPKTTSKPLKVETPKDTSKPIMINGRKVQKRSLGTGRKKQVPNTTTTGSWFGRNKGKVALGIGATAAAAYGIHRYRKNKKKKEEEARRQAELASQKKTGIKKFF